MTEKTDALVVEYVELPMRDLNFNFVYRFTEPVPTVWSMEKMSLKDTLALATQTNETDKLTYLSTFFLRKWKEMLPPDLQPPLGWENRDYMWLYDINKTCLFKFEIKPTKEVFGTN